MADAIIEIVGQDELPTIVELYNQVYRPARDLAGVRRRILGRYNVVQMIARVADRPVGFVLGYELSPEAYYAWSFGVHPDYRRQGIASQLLEALQEWARTHEYEALHIEAPNRARSVLHLAVHLGFDVAGVRVDAQRGDCLVQFEKSLEA
jgi:GNAT superfamily N-acetyltransferase